MTPRRRRVTLAAAVVALALLAGAALPWPTLLVYNPSASAPRGWYLRRPVRALRSGMTVLARLPLAVAALADRRGYLPSRVPVLKRVAALAPQRVCVRDGIVRIDGHAVATVRTRDGAGRPLVAWPGCRALRPDEVFLLSGDSAASFDGRYFGPVSRGSVFGETVPLWTW